MMHTDTAPCAANCGRLIVVVTESHMCLACWLSEYTYQDSHPAPRTDDDEYVTLNTYRGI